MNELNKLLVEESARISKRNFIIIIILIMVIFASNIFWIYSSIYYKETYTESYELDGSEDANVVYSNQGGVSINGEGEDK